MSWLIILLMAVVCIEVFKRYIMNMPTAWIFDLSNMLYGTLFMMCGAYCLAQNAHVRGDFLYSSMRPRTQAALDLGPEQFEHPSGAGAEIKQRSDRRAGSRRVDRGLDRIVGHMELADAVPLGRMAAKIGLGGARALGPHRREPRRQLGLVDDAAHCFPAAPT